MDFVQIRYEQSFINEMAETQMIDLRGDWELALEGAGMYSLGSGAINDEGWFWYKHQLPHEVAIEVTSMFNPPVSTIHGWLYQGDKLRATMEWDMRFGGRAAELGETVTISFSSHTDEWGNAVAPWAIRHNPEK